MDYALDVWEYLISNGCTKAGAAGILGNMRHESGVIPNRVEILCLKRIKEYWGESYNDVSYTMAVDSGRISKERFMNPLPGKQYGYGLCQWTSPNRKAGFYDLCKGKGVSIADIDCQLAWLLHELRNTYQSVWSVVSTSNDVALCTTTVLKKFEMPANPDSLKTQRVASAWEYYNKYKDVSATASETPQDAPGTTGKETDSKPATKPQKETQTTSSGTLCRVPSFVGMITADEVKVRTWAGPEYATIRSWPILRYTNLVDVCDKLKGSDNKTWYYIRIAGKYYGFIPADKIKRQ